MINFFVATILGVLSGFGAGGGSIFIIYLTMILSIEQIDAQGINLVYFIFCGVPALFLHYKNNLIVKKPAMYCSIAGVFACIISSVIANNITSDILQRIFGVFLLYSGISLLVKD